MSDLPAPQDDYDDPGYYEIRIKGHLDQRWAERFEGLVITLEANGNTLLSGTAVDQAALHGWLRKVRDLGMPLISVTRTPPVSQQDIRKLNDT